MGANSLGNRFKITSFGESHGNLVGVIIDGVSAGLDIDIEFIQGQVDLRRPGQSDLVTERKERDQVEILSGVFNRKSTGAPICLIIRNHDVKSIDYEKIKHYLRPSHVDFVALKRFGGYADYRGSGRFSGRVTAGFVMAGSIAKLLLNKYNISILAYTRSIGDIEDLNDYSSEDLKSLSHKREETLVRSLDAQKSESMRKLIEEVKVNGDSVGGTIKCIVTNYPPGIGEPVFNSLESNISKAIFSIPGVKGIEFGAGFRSTRMKGSEHNDPWIIKDGEIKTSKNDSGGIIGGISTGMPIVCTIAVKPTSTIAKPQNTVNIDTMKEEKMEFKGRHDPCIVPRAIVVVEAMMAVVLLDHLLINGYIPPIIEA